MATYWYSAFRQYNYAKEPDVLHANVNAGKKYRNIKYRKKSVNDCTFLYKMVGTYSIVMIFILSNFFIDYLLHFFGNAFAFVVSARIF